MKSNIQLKYSNYVAFSHFHGYAVNNPGLIKKDLDFLKSEILKEYSIDSVQQIYYSIELFFNEIKTRLTEDNEKNFFPAGEQKI